ncbi:hypothetical protein ACWDAF_42650, partial [Streptomyces sp. NPDC001226]
MGRPGSPASTHRPSTGTPACRCACPAGPRGPRYPRRCGSTASHAGTLRARVPFRQFIVKVNGRCNLACRYCYLY